jgi:hypothetical protein
LSFVFIYLGRKHHFSGPNKCPFNEVAEKKGRREISSWTRPVGILARKRRWIDECHPDGQPIKVHKCYEHGKVDCGLVKLRFSKERSADTIF